jgi:hypothetical protein
MPGDKSEILQGTVDLMVLKTPDAMGPLPVYGVARRIEQISEEALQINQGTIYASPVRLVQKLCLGHAGKQQKSEVLFHHQTWTQAQYRSAELGARFHGHWLRTAHRGARISQCLLG